jgi:hypothetical protein
MLYVAEYAPELVSYYLNNSFQCRISLQTKSDTYQQLNAHCG